MQGGYITYRRCAKYIFVDGKTINLVYAICTLSSTMHCCVNADSLMPLAAALNADLIKSERQQAYEEAKLTCCLRSLTRVGNVWA